MVRIVWLTIPVMYVSQIKGIDCATFVSEENKEHALDFETEEKAYSWLPVLNKMTGMHLSVDWD